MYDGEYIDGKREGKGKFICENGDYYVGEFKDNEFNGKGKLFDKKDNIIYDG